MTMTHRRDVTIDRAMNALLLFLSQCKTMEQHANSHASRDFFGRVPARATAPGRRTVGTALAGLLLTAALTGAGCGGSQQPLGPVTFAPTAKVNFDRGDEALKRKSFDRARRYFKHVRRDFPYSRYASLAELRLADCDFDQGNYAEAAAAYRRFLRLHRTHEKADHASFRRGLSYYKMIPSDWFLVPPSYERDMSATRDALRELRTFLRLYPRSDYVPEATKLVRESLDRLARHEMYVARFYLRRGKYKAAINRTRAIERFYSDSNFVPHAMFVRGETFMHMEDNEAAKETFLQLAARFPNSAEAQQAQDYLRYLGVDPARALAARAEQGNEEDEPESAPR